VNRSQTIGELAAALAAFHAEAKNPPKTKTADVQGKTSGVRYSYGFADLADVIDSARAILAKHGLTITQEIEIGEAIGARTLLLHTSGEFLEFEPVWMPLGSTAQEIGSAATYSRRYGLLAALNMAPAGEDDGGAAAASSSSGSRHHGRAAGASEKQLAKIRADVEAAGIYEAELASVLARRYGVERLEDLDRAQASDLIDRIAAKAKHGADPVTGEVAADAPRTESTESAQEPADEDPPGMGAEEFRARAAASDAPGPRAKHATNPQKAKIYELERELVAAGAMAPGERDRDLLEKYGVTARSGLTLSEASDVLETLIAAAKLAKGGA